MPRMSAAMEHALKVLEDGKWHPWEWALYEVSKGVPPNLAVRRAERDRVIQWMKEHPGVPKSDVPPRIRGYDGDLVISTGARSIAREVLTNEKFENVRHKESGQRLVRIFPIDAPTPPPEGYEHYLAKRSKFLGWSREEIRKYNQERSRKGHERRLRARGIDPATHKTQAQLEQERKEWFASLSPEEKAKRRSEAARKGNETRKRMAQEKKDT